MRRGGMDRDGFEELIGAMARSGLVRLVDSVFEKDGKQIPYRYGQLDERRGARTTTRRSKCKFGRAPQPPPPQPPPRLRAGRAEG